MSGPIRIGLLGLGRHGARYARHFAAHDVPGATLAAVWTRDPDKRARIAQELGVTAAPDMEALVTGEIDAVVAALPAGTHVEVAERCAAAGRPLLLEKPLARTTAEGVRICEAFEKANVELMIAQTLRFDPLVEALRMRRDEVGRLTGLSFEQRLEPRGLAWEDEPEISGGGVLIQTAIHTLDAARFVTEAARVEVLHAHTGRTHYTYNEDLGLVILAFEGGPALPKRVVGDVRVSKIGGSRHMRFCLFGTEAGLEADFIARTLTKVVGRERTVERVPDRPTVPTVSAAFVRLLSGDGANPVPGREALASLALVEGAYAAARAQSARRG